MLSYVAPVIQAGIKTVNESMSSPEQFFESFEGPDLSAILAGADDEEDDDPVYEVSAKDFNQEDDKTDGLESLDEKKDVKDENVLSLSVRTGGFRND